MSLVYSKQMGEELEVLNKSPGLQKTTGRGHLDHPMSQNCQYAVPIPARDS